MACMRRRTQENSSHGWATQAGKGCVAINTLADVDMTILSKLVASAAAKKGREG
jgi:hypothetical protein